LRKYGRGKTIPNHTRLLGHEANLESWFSNYCSPGAGVAFEGTARKKYFTRIVKFLESGEKGAGRRGLERRRGKKEKAHFLW